MTTKYTLILLLYSACIHLSISVNIFSKAKQNPKCKKIGATKKLDLEWALELFIGKQFYMPMGSLSALEDLTELLSGTKATSPEEIDKMCPEVKTKGFKSTVEGYDGRFMVVDCALITKGVQECQANPRTEFPDRHKAVHAIQTLAWTDNKSSIIVVRCTPDGNKNDWVLYSLNTTLADDLKDIVLETVKEKGFETLDVSKIHYTKYDACKLIPDDK